MFESKKVENENENEKYAFRFIVKYSCFVKIRDKVNIEELRFY